MQTAMRRHNSLRFTYLLIISRAVNFSRRAIDRLRRYGPSPERFIGLRLYASSNVYLRSRCVTLAFNTTTQLLSAVRPSPPLLFTDCGLVIGELGAKGMYLQT